MSIIQSNRHARIAAIQALYAHHFLGNALDEILEQIFDNYIEINKLNDSKMNKELMVELTHYAFEEKLIIEQEISKHLTENWRFERLGLILQVILRLAVAELSYLSTPSVIVISEYTTITGGFFDTKEVGFVNSILDKLASHLRPMEAKQQ